MYYEAVRLVVDEAFEKYCGAVKLDTDFAQKTLRAFAEMIVRDTPVAMPDTIEKAIDNSLSLMTEKDPTWAAVPPALTLVHTLKKEANDEKIRYPHSYSSLCLEHWESKCEQLIREGKLGKNEN